MAGRFRIEERSAYEGRVNQDSVSFTILSFAIFVSQIRVVFVTLIS
jgi:hypothetical protein